MQDEGFPSQVTPDPNATQNPPIVQSPLPPDPPLNYSEPVHPIEGGQGSGISGTIKRVVSLLIILGLFAGLITGGYYIWKKYGGQIPGVNRKVSDASQDGNNTTQEKEESPQNKETYTNSSYSFRFNYSKDMTLREDPSGDIYLAKLGPTQKQGTEMYDGIWLSITPGKLSNKSVKEVVDARIKELSSQANSSITKQPELINIAGKTAYRFEVEGLGIYIYYYFALGPDNYVVVVDGTRDPGNQGFASQVEEVIKSIEFLGPPSSS